MSSANGSQTQKVLNLGSWKKATSRSEFTLNEQKLTSESSRRRNLFPSAPCSFVFSSRLQQQEAVLLLGRGRGRERGRCTFMFRVYRRGKVQARAYGGRLGALLRCSWSGQVSGCFLGEPTRHRATCGHVVWENTVLRGYVTTNICSRIILVLGLHLHRKNGARNNKCWCRKGELRHCMVP